MLQRGSIPVRYWPRLLAKAEADKIEGVTYDALVAAHAAPAADLREVG